MKKDGVELAGEEVSIGTGERKPIRVRVEPRRDGAGVQLRRSHPLILKTPPRHRTPAVSSRDRVDPDA